MEFIGPALISMCISIEEYDENMIAMSNGVLLYFITSKACTKRLYMRTKIIHDLDWNNLSILYELII